MSDADIAKLTAERIALELFGKGIVPSDSHAHAAKLIVEAHLAPILARNAAMKAVLRESKDRIKHFVCCPSTHKDEPCNCGADDIASRTALPALLDYVEKLEGEIERLRAGCMKMEDDIQQTLGKALGYPRYCDDKANFPNATEADGVCVGEHVAESLADEAAAEIERLKKDGHHAV